MSLDVTAQIEFWLGLPFVRARLSCSLRCWRRAGHGHSESATRHIQPFSRSLASKISTKTPRGRLLRRSR